jgi:MFS family permease
MWIELALLSAVAAVLPLAASRLFADPGARRQEATAQQVAASPAASTTGLVVCYGLFGFGYILPATYLPALARQLVDDPQVFGLAWPLFGAAAALSTVVASLWLKKANRLTIWAASHVLMAIGVLLPSMWRSLVSIAIAALLVGGTFMVITMIAMQEARARDERNATVILARMTAGFAFGQLLGPVVSAVLTRWTADATSALHLALALSAGGLILSAGYLWRELRKQTAFNGNKP